MGIKIWSLQGRMLDNEVKIREEKNEKERKGPGTQGRENQSKS